jgi:DNA-directed RNA polymerase subunit RPC12/RpoP
MRIELNCAKCGENRFDLHATMPDDAHVSCAACGHKIGTMTELKERVAAEVLRRSAKG